MLWRRSLASKLKPPVVKPPASQDLVHRQRQLVDRVRELVRVPAVLVVAPVGIDAAEQAVAHRVGHLVVEAVAGERRVVGLEVEPVLALEAVPDEEAVDRRRVAVVLVLRRLLRLRLDQERAPRSRSGACARRPVQEPPELPALAPRGRC